MAKVKSAAKSAAPIPCGQCPAFEPDFEWDWRTPIYLKQTRQGPNGEEEVLDAEGKPILRKGPDGQPIRLGSCVLRSIVQAHASPFAFPRRLSTMRCEDPEKHALLARLGMK